MNLSDVDLNQPQQVFDFVVEKLQQQGCKSKMAGGNRCKYRGTNGAKCAAGHLIPDEEYDSSEEGMHCTAVKYFKANITNPTSWQLLGILQNRHDDHDPSNWHDLFKQVAKLFLLDTTHLERVYSTKLIA